MGREGPDRQLRWEARDSDARTWSTDKKQPGEESESPMLLPAPPTRVNLPLRISLCPHTLLLPPVCQGRVDPKEAARVGLHLYKEYN